MQIGLRQGLVNAALIGPKGTAALQHQCDPLERRALSRDMGLAQQSLTAGHYGPPVLAVRCSTIPRVVEAIIPVLKALNAVSCAARFGPLKMGACRCFRPRVLGAKRKEMEHAGRQLLNPCA